MLYLDRQLRTMQPDQWAKAYRDPKIAIVAMTLSPPWKIVSSWIGIANFDGYRTDKIFLLQVLKNYVKDSFEEVQHEWCETEQEVREKHRAMVAQITGTKKVRVLK